MIAWLQPAALAGLAALAGPIVVHLLRRQRAARLPFPAIRFIQPSRAAAIRVRLPSDVLLLAVRIAIVAIAALAWAQPLLVTRARIDGWNARLARAVVVDASQSMRVPDAAGDAPIAEARARADRESVGVLTVSRIEHTDLRVAIQQALEALSHAPPARRELVVISDFQQGAIDAADVSGLPAGLGVRLVRVGQMAPQRRFEGGERFGRVRVSRDEVELTGATTAVKVTAGTREAEGLRIVGAEDAEVVALLETVARAGTPAPSAAQPITIAFGGRSADAGAAGPRVAGWAVATTTRLQEDPDLKALAPETDSSRALDPAASGLTLFAGRDGRPLLGVRATDRGLILDAAVEPSSLFAAAVVRGALNARTGAPAFAEQEILTIPASTLSAWSRPPGEVTSEMWRHADRTDARWFWGAVLLILALESAAVARRRQVRPEVQADAA